MARLVEDFQINGKWVKYQGSYENQKQTITSQLWNAMCLRCKEGSALQKSNPTYIGCSMSDDFKDFQFFAGWCQEQVGFGNMDAHNKRWALEKDLLVKGNRMYCKDRCVFLPLELNNLLLKSNRTRGEFPVGVHYSNTDNCFVAQVMNDEKKVFLGRFDNPHSAFLAYKFAKENIMKVKAEKWKMQIDLRAYNALTNYTVEETD